MLYNVEVMLDWYNKAKRSLSDRRQSLFPFSWTGILPKIGKYTNIRVARSKKRWKGKMPCDGIGNGGTVNWFS